MLNPWVLLGLVVAWVASLAGAFHFGTSYEEGQHAKTEVAIKDAVAATTKQNQQWADGVGARVETALGNIRITNRTINNEIHHEREIQTRVLDNPDCALPDSTVQLLNRQRGLGGPDGSGAGQPASAVPAARPAEAARPGD